MKKHKGRPIQPKCPHCGKPLYKRMNPGPVQKDDPYGWCRNEACEWYNKSQTEMSSFTPLSADAMCQRIKQRTKTKVHRRAQKKKQEPPGESHAVIKARTRIKAVVSAAQEQLGPSTVGLALAIVTQETGNYEAANLLIKEYKLEKLYGIQPYQL